MNVRCQPGVVDPSDCSVFRTEPSSSAIRGAGQNGPEPGSSAAGRDHPDYRRVHFIHPCVHVYDAFDHISHFLNLIFYLYV